MRAAGSRRVCCRCLLSQANHCRRAVFWQQTRPRVELSNAGSLHLGVEVLVDFPNVRHEDGFRGEGIATVLCRTGEDRQSLHGFQGWRRRVDNRCLSSVKVSLSGHVLSASMLSFQVESNDELNIWQLLLSLYCVD